MTHTHKELKLKKPCLLDWSEGEQHYVWTTDEAASPRRVLVNRDRAIRASLYLFESRGRTKVMQTGVLNLHERHWLGYLTGVWEYVRNMWILEEEF